MISQHKKYIRTKQEIIQAKEEALEAARLAYIERTKSIMDEYHSQVRSLHLSALSSEILHGA